MPRLWLFVTLCFCTGLVQAGVYQCQTADGRTEYRDTPCTSGVQRIYQKSKLPPGTRTKVTRTQEFRPIIGQWCNFATSLSMTGTKDVSQPSLWSFGETQLNVTNSAITILSDFNQQQSFLQVEDTRLGNYHLIMQGADSMVMKGDFGYYFFRRGSCPTANPPK